MVGQNVGYIRVSTAIQNTERQLDHIDLDEVFTEKLSGKDTDRPQLQACMTYVRKGDVLHVHSIDRLSRNLLDLQNIVSTLVAKGVTVRFHKENLEFSNEGDPFRNLMLQMLGAFAEFERTMINERRREGMEVAKKKGTKFGRPRKLTDKQRIEIRDRLLNGEDKTVVAAEYGVSRPLMYSILEQRS